MSDATSSADAARARTPIEQWLDVTVYAPVGLALGLRDQWPRYVATGRQAVENRVQLARFIGRLALQQARAEVAKRTAAPRAPEPAVDGDPVAAAEELLDELFADDPLDVSARDELADATDAAPTPVEGAPDADGSDAVGGEPEARDLPITDYESLAAVHVVQRLSTLRADELELVRRFEAAHRARRTILAKVAQLQGD